MLQKIKNLMLMLTLPLMMLAPVMATGMASAVDCTGGKAAQGKPDITGSLETGVVGSTGGTTTDDCATDASDSSIGTVAGNIVNLLSLVIGAVAVIMIIYAGFRYITSGGESNGVSSAKNSLIYAIIGLVIVVLAQIIVHFVINTAGSATK